MKALIIGGAGFVGGYLIEELLNNSYEVYVTCLENEKIENPNCNTLVLDILDSNAVSNTIKNIMPDIIFHLAAQSSVAVSWKNPQLTVNVNINGTLNILDEIRKIEGYSPKILLIGSGEEYGYIREGACPLNEGEKLRPGNIYAATKACQSMIGEIYTRAYNMNIIMVRAFNHIGPNQSPQFVLSDFAKQVAEIEAGNREPEVKVGNLSAKRDFTDVRDVVRSYVLLVENGVVGETYNVGSGDAVSIQHILDVIIKNSKIEIKVSVDESRLRPVDIPIIEADISKIKSDVNWTPQIPLEKTIVDTLNYWRNIVSK